MEEPLNISLYRIQCKECNGMVENDNFLLLEEFFKEHIHQEIVTKIKNINDPNGNSAKTISKLSIVHLKCMYCGFSFQADIETVKNFFETHNCALMQRIRSKFDDNDDKEDRRQFMRDNWE